MASTRMTSAFLLLLSLSLLVLHASAQSSLTTVPTRCVAAPVCNASAVAVPPAWYNLTFGVSPLASVGSTSLNYGWEATEAGDVGCSGGYQHQGIATFNGSLTQFVDLNFATGANSSGAALPGIIGFDRSAGSVAAGTAGWSFEVTFRPSNNSGNAKTYCGGAGTPSYNIFFGNDGGTNAGMNFGLYDNGANGYNAYHNYVVEFAPTYVEYQWYHVVAVLQTLSSGVTRENNATHGAWWIYVNGQLLTYPTGVVQTSILPTPVPRLFYLAKSVWGDPAWTGLIDTFRIYNVALSGSQVSTLYQGEMGGCPVPISSAAPTGAALAPLIPARIGTGPVTPIFSLNFSTNPLTSVAGATGYGWAQTLSSDSAGNQSLHTGLLTFDASQAQYVNLSQASGANSVGQVLPIIGGGTAGWSFELMLLSTAGADTWPKVMDIGQARPNAGNCNYDFVLGWEGSANAGDPFWQWEVCDGNGNQWESSDAIGLIPYATWFHVVATISPPTSNGYCNYFTYVNGQLYNSVNSGYCPPALVRQNALLGKSNWNDPAFAGALDFFNVYSQQLSDTQIAALYAAATSVAQPAPTSSSTGGAASAASAPTSAAAAGTGGSVPSGSGSSLTTVPTRCVAAPVCNASAVAVPPAWYNLTFGVSPLASVGSTSLNYGWEATEAGDVGCSGGYQHQGIATFNGSLTQFVDLNFATGANSSGAALPGIIGFDRSAGSVAAGTAGWSFEVTFRPSNNSGNAKTYCGGAGTPSYNIFFGNDGGTNAGMNFGLYDNGANGYNAYHNYVVEFAPTYVEYQWYHVVAVLQTLSSGVTRENNATHGAWWIYVNGQLLTYPTGVVQTSILPTPVPRLFYLAKSVWGDPAWTGLIDTFRIYNVALSGSQVSTLYQGEMGGCPVPISSAAPTGAALAPLIPARIGTGPVTPIFSLNFSTNPLTSVAGATGYGWAQTLSSDSAGNQSLHTGLLTFDASQAQYVNLSQASGANSVGQVLPIIGGGTAGWSFELMLLSTAGADTWPKVMDIGQARPNAGNCNYDFVLGWEGSANAGDPFWQWEVCDGNGNQWESSDAIGLIPYATWFHVVATISPPTSNGYCNYFTYVNGQLYNSVNSGYCPPALVRQNALLGKSNWNDPAFAGALDFFNVYSQQLSDTQIASLYATALGLAQPPTPSSTAAPAAGASTAAASSVSAAAGAASASSAAAVRASSSAAAAPTTTPTSAPTVGPTPTSTPAAATSAVGPAGTSTPPAPTAGSPTTPTAAPLATSQPAVVNSPTSAAFSSSSQQIPQLNGAASAPSSLPALAALLLAAALCLLL